MVSKCHCKHFENKLLYELGKIHPNRRITLLHPENISFRNGLKFYSNKTKLKACISIYLNVLNSTRITVGCRRYTFSEVYYNVQQCFTNLAILTSL